jgi:HEAT repeat protein
VQNALEPLIIEAAHRGPITPVRGSKSRDFEGAQAGKSSALLEVTDGLIKPFMLAGYTPGMQMVLTYHCYVTAIRHIGLSNANILLMDVTNRKNTLEQSAIALAMAQLGNRSAWPSFETLRRDPDWAVRLLSYEGMILLADLLHIDVDAMQLASLKDKDPRVSLACAYLMLLTKREEYEMPILILSESMDSNRREAFLGPLAWLARNGNEQARAKLNELAREDPDERVRASAGLHQVAISPRRGRVLDVS